VKILILSFLPFPLEGYVALATMLRLTLLARDFKLQTIDMQSYEGL
jgi:hypothetical protein